MFAAIVFLTLLQFGSPRSYERTPSASNGTRPNILILLIDDMGYSDIASFGSPNVSTPHLDALVRRGMKFTQWVSAAPICTPSRAALQTGRYPIRTGCVGTNLAHRVIPSPATSGGLDPNEHLSLAAVLKKAGYATGMSGKWHLGDNSNGIFQPLDHKFHPNAHGYDTFLGSTWTNAPLCEMNGEGVSGKFRNSAAFCFLMANHTVVQQPLRIENFTSEITNHFLDFLDGRVAADKAASATFAPPTPWFFFMSYFHVHSPLFVNRRNKGRSIGGHFGDNVEELDDSVGTVMTAVRKYNFENNTLIFMTSDNGPYQEEGWDKSGRSNMYDDATGRLLGRLKGGKGQLYEGGIRVPGAVVWPGVVRPSTSTDTFVSTMDIFPTLTAAANVNLGDYKVDGKDMGPILRGETEESQHRALVHYCGFLPQAARIEGRFKVFWASPKWYTNDPKNFSVCTQCCNGDSSASKLTGAIAKELCGCQADDLEFHAVPLVYDMLHDPFELFPLSPSSWPSDAPRKADTFEETISVAEATRANLLREIHPEPDKFGAGTCTRGLPSMSRQPCCGGCYGFGEPFPKCRSGLLGECTCNEKWRAKEAPETTQGFEEKRNPESMIV